MTNASQPSNSQSEIERKYDVEEGARVPDLTVVDGIESVDIREPVQLEAVYYDTEDLDLSVRRIVVRRRTGGGDAGWHIKKPAAEGRTELHWPLGDDTGTVPDEILESLREWVRDRELTPLARIATTRTAIHLKDAAADDVVEVADDEVTATDIRHGDVRSWREWEVELLGSAPDTEEGRTALLDAIERVIADAGAHPSTAVAKIARALGTDSLTDLLPTEPGTTDGPGSGDDGHTASAVLLPVIAELVDAVKQTDPAARADEPDAVHRMRTIVRRLRSILAAYRRLFDRDVAADLRERLSSIGDALGEARDLEVQGLRAESLLDELNSASDDTDARSRLVAGAHSRYETAHERLRDVLASAEYARLLDDLDAFIARPPLTAAAAKPAKKVLKKILARETRRVQKRADAVGTAGGDLETQLHAVRRAGRRLRYTAEAAEAAGLKSSAAVADAGERVQDSLGEHRDSVIFCQHLAHTAERAEAEGEKTAVYAALSELAVRSGTAALAGSSAALNDIRELTRG